ncbi:TetR family transcriptional regulator [Microbacterium sp. W1N]|uniref:acyl-CoA-like ligand-binding transcription factor n=1 Tax=Microbacterium festucae TaxID=2977531 RepID=UPI0021BDF7AF|nr:TetR family transcriptional regulator [Microbacterium festucae]MCT9821376.1 TetR family transcriptional regulator [Microbacterium festucae]
MLLLREIDALGYENVTMAHLAATAGTSVRTLHRYFPSKADIVWGGIDTSLDALRAGFAEIPDGAPVLASVRSVVLEVLGGNVDAIDVLRTRLRLISASSELRRRRAETFDSWRDELIRFVARAGGTSPDALVPVALGTALHATITAAILWWATEGDERDPAEVVAEGLDAFDGLDPAGPSWAGMRSRGRSNEIDDSSCATPPATDGVTSAER